MNVFPATVIGPATSRYDFVDPSYRVSWTLGSDDLGSIGNSTRLTMLPCGRWIGIRRNAFGADAVRPPPGTWLRSVAA